MLNLFIKIFYLIPFFVGSFLFNTQFQSSYETNEIEKSALPETSTDFSRYKLKIHSIFCHSQEDFFGTDQVYLKIDGERYTETKRISRGGVLDCSNLSRKMFDSSVNLELWEYDWEGDDLLLSFTLYGDEEAGKGEQQKYGTYKTAEYTIRYEVFYNY
jgi:hypothetical protein